VANTIPIALGAQLVEPIGFILRVFLTPHERMSKIALASIPI